MKARNQVSPLMHELSSYMAGAIKRKLPGAVSERAKLHLVDTFAAMLSGSRLLPGRQATAFVKSSGKGNDAGVIGSRVVTTSLNAALANGMCGHADETDDTHPLTRTHPGTSVVPAALAITERNRLPGKIVLPAMVLGYDICARMLLAIKATPLLRSGHHPGAKGQLFGAAATGGALLGFNAERMRYLLSYAAQQAAGLATLYRDTHHVEKAFVTGGMPAHDGVRAALMVASGFTGVEDVLSGEANLLSTFSADPDSGALIRGLGREYEIMRASLKRWSVGGPIQAPLHVLQDLIQSDAISAGQVRELVVALPAAELKVVNNRDMPDICLQHMLAVMLLDGTASFAAAHDFARMQNPAVRRLRKRIRAVTDEKLAAGGRGWRCAMNITLKDGRTLSRLTMAAKGVAENPLTRAEVEDKALDLMSAVIGKQRSLKLIAALRGVESIKDMRTLRRLYAA